MRGVRRFFVVGGAEPVVVIVSVEAPTAVPETLTVAGLNEHIGDGTAAGLMLLQIKVTLPT
jgi:hypothetical protein